MRYNGLIIITLTAASWAIVFLILQAILALATPTPITSEKLGATEAVTPVNITGVY